ncbi:ribokinase [Bailinhaonella thermotolerans]|uniref:Ribokinase n=1 Tax=Bailinhaonella thermotolerans TaxID=1070861 RepID=A0A3A4A7J0_9ACTN|nr:ribokinase [Bailinhaonella thermotolerans]RJL22967.1 ribokinase [Bailinhaonella thermotolerans]
MTAIAVFGSANMDLVAYVPAAPRSGETVTGREFRTIPGGKGANQAVAAARAGASVVFLGAVGDDEFGPRLRETLDHAGVDVRRLRTVPGASGVAHIVVDDNGGNRIIVIPGANGSVTGLDDADVAALRGCDALLLQLELPMEAVLAGARAGRAAGVPVVLTPAPARELPADLLADVDLLIPNEHEAAAITGAGEPRAALAALLERVPEVALTMGERGVLYGSRGAEPLHVPAVPVRAVDTTAAGDTFAGALAVARAEGRAPAEALRFATAAAALSVQRHGASTSMPSRAEIDAALSPRPGERS